jgi:drug/metabolite transporter (DMT)-like permease
VTQSSTSPLGRFEGIVTILLTLACWTSIPLFLNFFAKLIDPWTANGWRYGFSALIWLPVLVWVYARRRVPPNLWKRALWPSIFNAVAQVGFGLAPYYVSPGLMTFSLRLQIVFVTIGAAIMFAGERRVIRHPIYLAGLLMVCVGTAGTLLARNAGLGLETSPNVPLGVGLSVASGLLYACYALSVRKQLAGVNPLVAFSAISQYTAVALVGLMLCFGNQAGAEAWTKLSNAQFGWLLASALIGIGIGHTLYYVALGRLGVAPAAGVIQLQPITVSLIGISMGVEHLNGWQWTAGTIAVLGAAVMLIIQARVASAARKAAGGQTEAIAPTGEPD